MVRHRSAVVVRSPGAALLFALGQASVLEDAYAATGWLLVGLLQLAVMLVVIAPLALAPGGPLRDHAAVRGPM